MNDDINDTGNKTDNSGLTLLFVDDEQNILSSLKRLFRSRGYRILTALSGKEGLAVMENDSVDLIISDMRMPEMDGAAFLQQAASRWPDVVRILLTGYSDITSTIAAVNLGRIYRYVSKPWEDNDILLTVKRALEQKCLEKERQRLEALTRKQNAQLKTLNASLEDKVVARTSELQQAVSFLELAQQSLNESYCTTVEVFSNLVEMREHHGRGWNRRIAHQVSQVAELSGLDSEAVRNLHYAALLRNIGKISLSDQLVRKSFSTMNDSESRVFIQHPVVGAGVLMALEPLQGAADLIHHQHENFDGSGFPDGLKGDAILLGARILKVAGDYHDLQYGLLLSAHLKPSQARDYLLQQRGRRYDPDVVALLQKVLGRQAESQDKIAERSVKSNGLQSGMVLSRDLMLNDEILLLSRGHQLSEAIIERIYHMEESIDRDLEIYVLIDRED
ncbi:MAG TPA: response regulator [Gammaproteobacteria bacterium]|nr:response regulator [Gammaproteobacteria bacterium]